MHTFLSIWWNCKITVSTGFVFVWTTSFTHFSLEVIKSMLKNTNTVHISFIIDYRQFFVIIMCKNISSCAEKKVKTDFIVRILEFAKQLFIDKQGILMRKMKNLNSLMMC